MNFSPDPADDAPALIGLANRCVACGLCLPHCPTYRKTLLESDSPRGRIALLRATLEGRLAASPRLLAHLDQCLGCLACERVCPSRVAYGRLADGGRALLAPHRPGGRWRRIALAMLAWPAAWRPLGGLLRLWQATGQRRWRAGRLADGRVGRLEALLPSPRPAPPRPAPAAVATRGEIGLFLGCVARPLDADTLADAAAVLQHLGYRVRQPAAQGCCGALHRRAGDARGAAGLAARNRAAFAGLDSVVGCASGCGAALRDSLPGYRDICELLGALDLSGLRPAPLAETVWLHRPCSARGDAGQRLLARIPGIELVALAGNDQCCGGAGAYPLDQPEMAQALLADKIAALRARPARYLVTSNIGCALHLAAGARRTGIELQVLHPVSLLARQLATAC